jgi:translation initiation factor 3 subunit C
MSRFFHGGDSSSESSSSDEEELYSDNEQPEKLGSGDEPSDEEEEDEDEDEESSSDEEGGKTGASRFMRDAAESEESEDEDKVTVVKSAKDKRLEELEGTVKLIENAEKINDWAVISSGEYSMQLRILWGIVALMGDFCRIRQVESTDREAHAVWSYAEAIRQSYCRP